MKHRHELRLASLTYRYGLWAVIWTAVVAWFTYSPLNVVSPEDPAS
jgi:hypothetical protein